MNILDPKTRLFLREQLLRSTDQKIVNDISVLLATHDFYSQISTEYLKIPDLSLEVEPTNGQWYSKHALQIFPDGLSDNIEKFGAVGKHDEPTLASRALPLELKKGGTCLDFTPKNTDVFFKSLPQVIQVFISNPQLLTEISVNDRRFMLPFISQTNVIYHKPSRFMVYCSRNFQTGAPGLKLYKMSAETKDKVIWDANEKLSLVFHQPEMIL